ncbi:MAG: DUF2461 domain-containing protein [Gemmatimonadetes bacterium]|jgi:uncharacterized protein (TIGR02453 family)|nr:DUF2461 domain-containing protein [Gemmatimonadota bacterium]MBT7863997.1 DUF2461 domain-containing protein [Gemmatimonadota bacterium]
MATHNPYITPKLFKFFRDLKKNNERDWFEANKQRFEDDVRSPLLAFIDDFAEPLYRISPHFRADPRKVGGSLFRIFRDVRFSKDKTPYKTHAGVHFRHENAKSAHAPGFYLHLAPGEVFMGAGIWRPETAVTREIRAAILEHPDKWKKAIRSAAFTKGGFSLDGESLKRPPAGVEADHPFIEDLKRKDFISLADLSEKEVCAPGFPKLFADKCKSTSAFVKFLCEAVGQPY